MPSETTTDRKRRRRDERAKRKAASRTKVYIPIPEEFLDLEEEPWTLRGVEGELDLVDVIAHTVRRCPVKTGDDAEHTLDIFQAIREQEDYDEKGYLEMPKADFEWMIAHFKEVAHGFWLPPDARFLIRYLENAKLTRIPEADGDQDKTKAPAAA